MSKVTKKQKPETHELYGMVTTLLTTNGAMQREELISQTKKLVGKFGYSTQGVAKELKDLLTDKPWQNVVEVKPGCYDYVVSESNARSGKVKERLKNHYA